METSSLSRQFLHILDRSGFNNMVRNRALAAWSILGEILAEHQGPVETLKTIPPESLSCLAHRLPKDDVESMMIELAAIRVVLLQAGHTPPSISGLQVKTKRRRVENSPGGKYRYVKALDDRIR
jgi:hypothetical protein